MSQMAPAPSDRPPVLGCIADDVTGATDLAINLVQGGMRVVQVLGVPTPETLAHAAEADAVVVALKTWSIPAVDAIGRTLDALRALQNLGVERFYFKYCSTFDSTPAGNIGPVAEALMEALDATQTVYCPAFPRAGRTVYRGHLFVFDRPLNESGMQDHPLTPMNDADLVRVLGAQAAGAVGRVDYDVLATGPDAIRAALAKLAGDSIPNVVADTCSDEHLQVLAEAVADFPLVTGGSGLARFLPAAYRGKNRLGEATGEAYVPDAQGRSLVLSGSCSGATRAQVRWAQDKLPVWAVGVEALLEDAAAQREQVRAWLARQDADRPALVASTAAPERVAEVQKKYGAERVASAVEDFFGRVARESVERLNVRRVLVAGGETSGAVAAALGVRALRIGPEIGTGVSWTQTLGQTPTLALAFKSGNFGDEDIFGTAWEKLP